jgi:hypothetical protein
VRHQRGRSARSYLIPVVVLVALAGACASGEATTLSAPVLVDAPRDLAFRTGAGALEGAAVMHAPVSTPTPATQPTPTPSPTAIPASEPPRAVFGHLDLPGPADTSGSDPAEAADVDSSPPDATEQTPATPSPELPSDPDERLAAIASDDAELTVLLLRPDQPGYESIADHLAAGHHGTAFEVTRQGTDVTAAIVWAIAWDPDVAADRAAADDWIEWARGTRNHTDQLLAGTEVERLTEPGTPLEYVLAIHAGTAMLIADIGGGDEVLELLVARLGA